MQGERWLLRVGEFLVARAARRLPAAVREERRREWEAELPVVLSDPEIKSAAVRAARMLSFAADTLRGSALRPDPGPARYRGTHRGATTWGKDDFRLLAVGLAFLLAFLTLVTVALALGAYQVYYVIFYDANLVEYGSFVLSTLVIVAVCLFWRRPAAVYWSWCGAGELTAGTGPHVSALAGQLGWGHPLPFTVISVCGYAVGAACIIMAGAIGVKSILREL